MRGLRVFFLALLVTGLFVRFAAAADVIYLKSGEVIRCEITALTDNILTYKTTIDLGGGRTASAQPTISPDLVNYIEFAVLPGETELLAEGAAVKLEAIRQLWDEKSRHLHRPRSNAGEIGLRYGERLLAQPEDFQWDLALAVYDRLLERDWNPDHRKGATKGRLRALIQLGRLDQAESEARDLARETEDAEMLIEAGLALAAADFERLKELEEENPKWEEDETVRPERERLYHQVIDQFLWPYLFHGTEEVLAARGLILAAEAYGFGEDDTNARACLEDVSMLYPATPSASVARERLAETPDPGQEAAPVLPNQDDHENADETDEN